jgi:hypothetical protein
MAAARGSDPQTSHEAAESVQHVTATQQAILKLLNRPMTDEQLVKAYEVAQIVGDAPRASASGVRSRRAELYQRRLVAPVGFAKTASGRKALVWSVE